MKEQEIEQELIDKLSDLKYTYRGDIKDRASLERNFREKFEELNRARLTDGEFKRLMEEIVTADVYAASQVLRETNTFEREDGTPLHYTLINTKDWCKNTFEAVNQLRVNTDYSHHVYDVVLLINGVPVVQIELKASQVSPRRAMEQIVDYKKDPGNGYGKTPMCFLQLFIVSNRDDTWYFANNNSRHFRFDVDEGFLPFYRFADRDNNKVARLEDFAEKFLAKCALGRTIGRYMVLVAGERKLLMMRPYQIYAVRAIVDRIHQNGGDGYIWHTTGSGKTLTSFKASTLLKDNPDIEKCLFVVDRKDLDRQTREEFNRFQDGCVEENTNTETLARRLLSRNYADKVIVTTIQKLGLALVGRNGRDYKKRLAPLRNKRVVFIFDECHRSQFGENHKAIKEFFPNAQLFGFTGTPIFERNATRQQIEGRQASLKTTRDIFRECLHEYTITHAIEDGNVLRFHVDYYKPEGENKPRPGEPPAKRAIVGEILEKHNKATDERKFNAMLATAGINDAIEYFQLFKTIQTERRAENPDFEPLNIACVFSPPAEGDKDVRQIQEDLPREKIDNAVEPEKKKEALKAIVADYNQRYGANHTVNEFDRYYQDVQKRVKDQQYPNRDLPRANKIDVVIVVDMLLTGFDSKFLNTLYVDKPLRYHGLIQAFSRTNRVLNKAKPFGNILDFRHQRDKVDEAIALFSGEGRGREAGEIWLVEPAPKVVDKLDGAVRRLGDFMRSRGLENRPEDVPNLKGDEARGRFIGLFKDVRRLTTQLDQYTDLDAEQKQRIDELMPKERLQGFKGMYLETARRLRTLREKDGENAPPAARDADFELVLFASEVIDYDYIMKLIAEYSQCASDKREMSRRELVGLIAADAKFIDERAGIEAYIETLPVGGGLSVEQVREGFEAFKAERRARELAKIAGDHGLEAAALQRFVDIVLQRMILDGDDLTELFAPLGLGWKDRARRKLKLMEDLIPPLRERAEGREISGLSVYEQ